MEWLRRQELFLENASENAWEVSFVGDKWSMELYGWTWFQDGLCTACSMGRRWRFQACSGQRELLVAVVTTKVGKVHGGGITLQSLWELLSNGVSRRRWMVPVQCTGFELCLTEPWMGRKKETKTVYTYSWIFESHGNDNHCTLLTALFQREKITFPTTKNKLTIE